MKRIYVYENWSSSDPVLIGTIYVDNVRGTETYSFEYNEDWLKNTSILLLDPNLQLYSGRQFSTDKKIFGIISDSSPDRWGRLLMNRREKIQAALEQRKPKKLQESDYLLGVYDITRMGALRFKLSEDGSFVSSDDQSPVPPWTTLRTLEEASRNFENDENINNIQWLNQLLKPGSSLGGARPKASVVDQEGNLWIAKFPSKHDEIDVGLWEKVVHDLAKLCGLNVPESKIEKFSKYGTTFLVKRFDRKGEKRLHFSSAMTLLGKKDGASASDGTSYLDMVKFIKAYSLSPKEDLKELWKRVVFNMAISNIDDHLRNHGFLLINNMWRLSPLYDVNPSPYGDELSLNVTESDNQISFELAISTAAFYDLTKKEAEEILNNIICTVKNNWKKLASEYGLSRMDIEYMKPAFNLCEK